MQRFVTKNLLHAKRYIYIYSNVYCFQELSVQTALACIQSSAYIHAHIHTYTHTVMKLWYTRMQRIRRSVNVRKHNPASLEISSKARKIVKIHLATSKDGISSWFPHISENTSAQCIYSLLCNLYAFYVTLHDRVESSKIRYVTVAIIVCLIN